MGYSLPRRIVVRSYNYALDGGTTSLHCIDESSNRHVIGMGQHSFPEQGDNRPIPGRLWFDGALVSIRSEVEREVIALLKAAEIDPLPTLTAPFAGRTSGFVIFGADLKQVLQGEPGDTIRMLIRQIVDFVESDAYLRFADRVEQSADRTRYTVWLEFDPADRMRLIARLANVRRISSAAARDFVTNNEPVAVDVSAPEVIQLSEQYRRWQLRLRTTPPFPWVIN